MKQSGSDFRLGKWRLGQSRGLGISLILPGKPLVAQNFGLLCLNTWLLWVRLWAPWLSKYLTNNNKQKHTCTSEAVWEGSCKPSRQSSGKILATPLLPRMIALSGFHVLPYMPCAQQAEGHGLIARSQFGSNTPTPSPMPLQVSAVP